MFLIQFLVGSLIVLSFGSLNGFVVSNNFFLLTSMKGLHAFDVSKDVLVFKLGSAERSILEKHSASMLGLCNRPLGQIFCGWFEYFLDNKVG
jgi:hypothetical protein